MKSRAVHPTIYRIPLAVPCCGIAGLLFWLYVILYATKVIDWVLFSKVSEFRMRIEENGTIVFLLLTVGMGVYLLSSLCIKVTVTTSGLQYRRWFRPMRLFWCDVTRMTYSPHGIDICLWTKRDCIRFGKYLSRGRELLDTVRKKVSANAPGAEIVQAQPRFLPRWRKTEQSTNAKVRTGRP